MSKRQIEGHSPWQDICNGMFCCFRVIVCPFCLPTLPPPTASPPAFSFSAHFYSFLLCKYLTWNYMNISSPFPMGCISQTDDRQRRKFLGKYAYVCTHLRGPIINLDKNSRQTKQSWAQITVSFLCYPRTL